MVGEDLCGSRIGGWSLPSAMLDSQRGCNILEF
jgi:hypothetical protein